MATGKKAAKKAVKKTRKLTSRSPAAGKGFRPLRTTMPSVERLMTQPRFHGIALKETHKGRFIVAKYDGQTIMTVDTGKVRSAKVLEAALMQALADNPQFFAAKTVAEPKLTRRGLKQAFEETAPQAEVPLDAHRTSVPVSEAVFGVIGRLQDLTDTLALLQATAGDLELARNELLVRAQREQDELRRGLGFADCVLFERSTQQSGFGRGTVIAHSGFGATKPDNPRVYLQALSDRLRNLADHVDMEAGIEPPAQQPIWLSSFLQPHKPLPGAMKIYNEEEAEQTNLRG